ncbi:CAP domain-containing protein [Variovorax sp. KBS0712]|uniref:CAP domain-containing protein n=1 Tax=Variovorax sp. KBS0712 TaxID=2578111 RepID=UPI001119EC63|nr:CAP domain-containing protein [Variovorax sp. KBS0712]TSD59048.1 CAP domain-containing protein [Variovorax sp. KBS0712]TSD59811.1 CAP domain-containing protein [Variovorax sp. KBS0712]
MKTKNKLPKFPSAIALSAAALVLLSACGGGGGGSGGGIPLIAIAPPPDTGTPATPPAQPPVAPPPSQPGTNDPSAGDTASTIVTSVPGSTYGAGSEELAAYSALNAERSRCGFGLLAQNAHLDIAAAGHSNYLLVNNIAGHFQDASKAAFTGVTPTDRANAAGYGQGLILDAFADTTGANGNVLGPTEFAPQGRGIAAVRSLLSAPYHALDLLSPQIDVGISIMSSDQVGAATANFGPRAISQFNLAIAQGQFSQKPDGAAVQTYPCDGTTGTAYQLKNEQPNPVPGRDLSTNPVGQPIIVAVRVGQLITIQSATMLKKSDGASVTLRAPMLKANDPNFLVDPSRAIILPDQPLEPNTEYLVSVTGTNTTMADYNNGQPISTGKNPAITTNATGSFTKTFTFKTGG